MSDHEWVKSTLGHGNAMCARCSITSAEAAVLGMLNECDAPPKIDPIAQARSLAIDDAVKVVMEHVRGGRNVNGEFIEQRDEIVSRLEALKEAK